MKNEQYKPFSIPPLSIIVNLQILICLAIIYFVYLCPPPNIPFPYLCGVINNPKKSKGNGRNKDSTGGS